MQTRKSQRCERTGRATTHCGCSDCYARERARLLRNSHMLTIAGPSPSPERYPRYLVSHEL